MACQSIPHSYRENTKRFRKAARKVAAEIHHYFLDDYSGPTGKRLATDVALIGRQEASQVYVISSGLHGVELPIGSKLQLQWLAAAKDICDRNADIRFVFVHALNPYGAAHGLRNDGENIDPNRNFWQSHTPSSTHYRAFAEAVAPKGLGLFELARALKRMISIARKHSVNDIKQALIAGQYDFPKGIYYGGDHPSWSRRTWEKIVRAHVVNDYTKQVYHVDIHSGEGEAEECQFMLNGDANNQTDKSRTELRLSEFITYSEKTFGKTTGDITESWDYIIPEERKDTMKVLAGTLEFGTSRSLLGIQGLDVLVAMIARNTLSQQCGDKHWLKGRIIGAMRSAFNPQRRHWQEQAIANGSRFFRALTDTPAPS